MEKIYKRANKLVIEVPLIQKVSSAYDEKSFEITRIIKNEGLGDKFNVGDVIYLFSGMVSFHTQNCEKCECYPTVIIEQNKITLFEDNDDADNEDKE